MRNLILLIVVCFGLFFLSGCGDELTEKIKTGDTVIQDGNITDKTVKALNVSQPLPTFTFSNERANLLRHLKRKNDPTTITYIACLSMDGKVIMTSIAKGKVSSLSSLLTNPQQLVPLPYWSESGSRYIMMPSPDLDGSYGENPKGSFWYSPDSVEHTWTGDMLTSSVPFVLTTPPSISINMSAKEAVGK